MFEKSNISISTDGVSASFKIDGKEFNQILKGYSIEHDAGGFPKVRMDVGVTSLKFESDCCVEINGILVDEELEKELFKYLNKKYIIP